jgi:hypothetical protein
MLTYKDISKLLTPEELTEDEKTELRRLEKVRQGMVARDYAEWLSWKYRRGI